VRRQRAVQRGKAHERLARLLLEHGGFKVEPARNIVIWVPSPTGALVPRSARHDFYGVWDGIYVGATSRGFYQVTSQGMFAVRRHKILDAGFPCTADDLLMLHHRGCFRVVRGPLFLLEQGERWAKGLPGVIVQAPW
jgi:hypothetical protein